MASPKTTLIFQSPPSSPNPKTTMDTCSTSTSANPNSSHPYDIFINHRGPDTKKTFASHLYRRLLLHGCRAFLDQSELQQGDNIDSQIKAAIESASVHVAIFSPRYAESRWCLEELTLMRETDATIIPVFYHVKPSDLKWTRSQNSLYGQALHNHEQKLRYDSVTLEKWRNALYHVAAKSGFELKECNDNEGDLLEKVVECVLKKVKKPLLNVAKYPTGLDDKVKEFENTVLLQQQQSRKPQICGIVGLGGVGKTTFAKKLFNSKNSDYRNSCFLFDVRDNATRGSLNSLQSQLLKSLTGLDKAVDSIDEGIGVLQNLSSTKSLVVLDDVDNVNQLDAFLPIQTVLRSDSLILITSRDKSVLRSWVEETSIYKLNGLDAQHSRELFCSHAFRGLNPLPGFESLIDKFIKACDGLPLSLQLFGALLSGNDDQSEWQNHLDSLQQTLPSDIHDKLKISYDTLNEEEQKIFLDIACFFIGENKDKALRLWDGPARKGFLGFRNLHNKCLVELDSKNNIHMHDHVKDMGRAIAKDSKLKLPSRVRCSTHNLDDLLLQSNNEQVLTALRGIMVDPTVPRFHAEHPLIGFQYETPWLRSKMSWFKRISHELLGKRMMKFRNRLLNTGQRFLGVDLLDVEDGHMERILRRVQSPNLKWLRWYKYPYSSLPSWIPVKNLTFLEMGGSVLETLWQGQSQVPLKLKELQIYAPLSKIPKSIGQLKDLERIVIFSKSVNLKNLPHEFCHLASLKVLVLRRCSKLQSLPDSFGDLINLEHLNLSETYMKRLPDSFGNLIKLRYLCLKKCKNLTLSAQTLGTISTLEHLNLSGCTKIKVLPPQVAQQRSLAELILWGTNIIELPSAMGDLSELEVLKFGRLKYSLPPSFGELKNLKKLKLMGCMDLNFVGMLTQLTSLKVYMCKLCKLPFTKVEGQSETSTYSSFREFLPRLQHLKIGWEREISGISFGEGVCPNLHVLEIVSCRYLKKIEGLSGLTKLQKALILGCNELQELPRVEHCRSLKMLDIICAELHLKKELLRQLRHGGCDVVRFNKLSDCKKFKWFSDRDDTRTIQSS